MPETKFVALFDLHWGFERRGGHKVPVHDPKALSVALQFIDDFSPDVIILGGDMLDCRMVSHHTKHKPGQNEGFRLIADAENLHKELIKPLQAQGAKNVYITGNHEDWLNDLTDAEPGLSGLLDIDRLLKLDDSWKVVPQGSLYHLGKLTFLHGDQLKGSSNIALNAVTAYERSVRFGHFHTYQVATKTSAVDYKNAKTGVAVPCLCSKEPKYGEGAPNKWQQGFNWGYVNEGGTFSDYVSIIIDGRATINDKRYKG